MPPVVDGDVSDACWATSAVAVDFAIAGTSGRVLSAKQTEVRLVYDDRAIYVAVVCVEPHMSRLAANATTRDGSVFADDCVELFLDVDHDRATCFHLGINPLGTLADGRSDSRNRFRYDRSWNSSARVVAKCLNDRWLIELAIPFSALAVNTPRPGTHWGFNAAREHRAGEKESFSTWSALPGKAFHSPADFASLIFVRASPPAVLRRVSDMRVAVRNHRFSKLTADGRPVHWRLSPDTKCLETAYLAGTYELQTSSNGLMAHQEASFWTTPGTEYEAAIETRALGDPRIGLRVHYVTDDGSALTGPLLLDVEPPGSYTRITAKFAVPDGVCRISAFEVCCSGGRGRFFCREVRVSDLTTFEGIREAATEFAPHRHPIEEPFVSRATKWAVPLASGPLKVLFAMAGDTALRHVPELAQRLDLTYDLCWTKGDTLLAYGAQEINARLRREAHPYDVIVTNLQSPSDSLIHAVRQNVESGAGLVWLGAAASGENKDGFARLVGLADNTGSPEWAAHLDVLAAAPLYEGAYGEPAVAALTARGLGKGRAIGLRYRSADGVRGLLPVAANDPSQLRDWWECAYALIAKCVVAASGRTMPVRIESTAIDAQGATVSVRLAASKPFEGKLTLRWADKFSVADVRSEQVKVAVPANRRLDVDVAVPNTVCRSNAVHVGQLRLCDLQGNVVDWRAIAFQVAGLVRIDSRHPCMKDWFGEDEEIDAQVTLANSGRAPARLRVETQLIDSWNREVWSEAHRVEVGPMAQAQLRVKPAHDRCMTVYHVLRVDAVDEHGVLDRKEWTVYFPELATRVLDDFLLGGNASYYIRSHTDQCFTDWLRGLGFGFMTEGALFETAPRMNMPWHKFFIAWKPFHCWGRDPVRTPCLSDPDVIRDIAQGAVRSVRQCRKYAPVFYTIGDEIELTRDGRTEVCFSVHCAAGFRKWCRELHGSVAAANAEWGTQFTAWEQIGPIRAADARIRGNVAQWVDFRMFMEDVWNRAFVRVRTAVEAEFPGTLLSFSNPFGLNPFSGEDHARTAQVENIQCKYARPDLMKEFRSLNPTTPMHSFFGYLEALPACTYFPWWFAFNGGDIMVWWATVGGEVPYSLFDSLGRHTARSRAFLREARDLTHGVGKILHEFPPARRQIAVLYSQASMHVSWIASDMQVGDIPWSENRMALLPPSNAFGLFHKSRENTKAMIKESWLQADYVTPTQILDDRLSRYRLLVLPCMIALSDDVLSRIRRFVEDGGSVLADLRTGLYSSHGKRLPNRESVETLFGIRRRTDGYASAPASLRHGEQLSPMPRPGTTDGPVAWEHLEVTSGQALATHEDGTPALIRKTTGKGRAFYLNCEPGTDRYSAALTRHLFDVCGLDRPARFMSGAAEAHGYECYTFARGKIRYLGLLRDMTPQPKGERRGWFGRAFRHATPGKESVEIVLPKPAHVYDVRAGHYHGCVPKFSAALAPAEAKLFGLLPYRITHLTIDGPALCRQGEDFRFRVTVEAGQGQPGDHVLQVEVVTPGGTPSECYSKNVLAHNGTYSGLMKLALNEPPGTWLLRATDVTSRTAQQHKFEVVPR